MCLIQKMTVGWREEMTRENVDKKLVAIGTCKHSFNPIRPYHGQNGYRNLSVYSGGVVSEKICFLLKCHS